MKYLKWATPVLATLTALLEAGHLAHILGSETAVLILAILTAISGWVEAATPEPPQIDISPAAQKPPPTKGK